MSEIRINQFNGIQPQKADRAKTKQEEKTEQNIAKKEARVSQKEAKEVLNFMAQSAALNESQVKKREINPEKYVDAQSQERIAKMMKAFDDTILKSAEVAIKELGLSEAAGRDVAIMAFNQRFLV